MSEQLRRCAFLALALLGTSLFGGCYASNVVAQQDRAVIDELSELEWTPASEADVAGMWVSAEIQGEAAASLWSVIYLFETGGRYTAAALVAGEPGPSFQTMDGRWAWQPEGIALDGGAPQELSKSERHLRIAADTGTLVLRRMEQK